jgi:hypothetical protein
MAPSDESTMTHGNMVLSLDTTHGAAMVAIFSPPLVPLVAAHAGAPLHSSATWGFAVPVILEACTEATGFAVSFNPRDHLYRADA